MILKLVGSSLLTFAIVWALVLGWWQSNDHTPNTIELVLFLGALPLALVGGFLLLRGFIDHLKTPVENQEAQEGGFRDDDPLAGKAARDAATERTFRLLMAESCVLTYAGHSSDDILAAMQEGKRPQPSKHLVDASGLPVYAAEIEDIDTSEIAELLLKAGGRLASLAERERDLRILTLVNQVMLQAKDGLDKLLADGGDAWRLNVFCLVPVDWGTECLVDLQTWFRCNYWPDVKAADLLVSIMPVKSEGEVMRILDDLVVSSGRSSLPGDVNLVVAATSSVDAKSVEHLDASAQLFSPNHEDRGIPGEGAVALLFGHLSTLPGFSPDRAVNCSRINSGLRDKPVEAGGRVSGKLIQQLQLGLLDITGCNREQIKAVVADADQGASRIAEFWDGLGTTLEHLDPTKDCIAVGAVTGNLSPIAPLVALAVAHGKVLEQTAPTLCLSNLHGYYRAVWLLEPFKAALAAESNLSA